VQLHTKQAVHQRLPCLILQQTHAATRATEAAAGMQLEQQRMHIAALGGWQGRLLQQLIANKVQLDT
jgi:hypothetical protein